MTIKAKNLISGKFYKSNHPYSYMPLSKDYTHATLAKDSVLLCLKNDQALDSENVDVEFISKYSSGILLLVSYYEFEELE